MNRQAARRRQLSYLACCALLVSCAQIRGLEGGERDTRPPELLHSSPANFSTWFKERTIILTFDEYIQLNNLSQELIVSPPLAKPVSAMVKKKSAWITIEEALIPGTTYIFNFGNAIVDFTEGNKADVQYVFSTGGVIDSLVVSGVVTDAWTGKPAEGVRVMLYPDTSDTRVLQSPPLYLGRTNGNGEFRLSYLAPGAFHLVALAEELENYKLDPDERLAFSDSLVRSAVDDSMRVPLRLAIAPNLYLPKSPEIIRTDSLGMMRVFWPQQDIPLVVKPDRSDLEARVFRPPGNDTVTCWLSGASLNREEKIVLRAGEKADTIYTPYYSKAIQRAPKPVVPSDSRMLPSSLVRLIWPAPLSQINADQISWIMPDSSRKAVEVRASIRPNEMELVTDNSRPGQYKLSLLPGAITSIHGAVNDTLELSFTIPQPNEMGSIQLRTEGELKGRSLVLLLSDTRGNERWKGPVNVPGEWKITDLFPGEYELRIWDDADGDDRWTVTDFDSRKPAETVWVYSGKIAVRANWELDLRWVVE